jgi:hypothetical protein
MKSNQLSIRLNAQRVLIHAATQGRQSIDLVASANLFIEGLKSSSSSDQLDAIQGLSEACVLPNNQALTNCGSLTVEAVLHRVEPFLASPDPAVRLSAAFFIGNLNPNNAAALNVFNEVLALGGSTRGGGGELEPLDLPIEWVYNIMTRSSSAQLKSSFNRQIQNFVRQDVEHLYGRGPCILPYLPPLYIDDISTIMPAFRQLALRRLVSESFIAHRARPSDKLNRIISALNTYSLSGEPDLRYDAIYTLGMLLESLPRSDASSTKNINETIPHLKSISSASGENPELRQIASSMLSHMDLTPVGKDVGSKQDLANRKCPFASAARFEPGFEYDLYEDRCMYYAGGGCGAGLPEVFSSLRELFGKGIR